MVDYSKYDLPKIIRPMDANLKQVVGYYNGYSFLTFLFHDNTAVHIKIENGYEGSIDVTDYTAPDSDFVQALRMIDEQKYLPISNQISEDQHEEWEEQQRARERAEYERLKAKFKGKPEE